MVPPSMYLTATDSSRRVGIETPYDGPVNIDGLPDWVRKQRYSGHGVDHMYDGTIDFEDFYGRYCERFSIGDESIGSVRDWLDAKRLEENTPVNNSITKDCQKGKK